MKRFSNKDREPSKDMARAQREAEAELHRVTSAGTRGAPGPSAQTAPRPVAARTNEPFAAPRGVPSEVPRGFPRGARLPGRPALDDEALDDEGFDDDAIDDASIDDEAFDDEAFDDEWAEPTGSETGPEANMTPEEENDAILAMALNHLADRTGANPEDYVFQPVDPSAAGVARDAALARFFEQQAAAGRRAPRPVQQRQSPLGIRHDQVPASEERWVIGGRSSGDSAKSNPVARPLRQGNASAGTTKPSPAKKTAAPAKKTASPAKKTAAPAKVATGRPAKVATGRPAKKTAAPAKAATGRPAKTQAPAVAKKASPAGRRRPT